MDIKSVGVVGAGQMGNGIAHVMALSGYDVMLNDVSQEALDKGLGVIKSNMDRKEELGRQVEDCSNKLDRAQRLIGGLGGERSRWTQFAKELQSQYDNIVGDILRGRDA